MLILNSILYSYIYTYIYAYTHTYMERNNSVYPAHNFRVMQWETVGGGRGREKTFEMPNSTPKWSSQSPEKIISQEWIQAKRKTNSQRTQSRTIALLYPFLSHCSFSHINHLFVWNSALPICLITCPFLTTYLRRPIFVDSCQSWTHRLVHLYSIPFLRSLTLSNFKWASIQQTPPPKYHISLLVLFRH